MTTFPMRALLVLSTLTMPGFAQDAKPAPAAVRAKAVIIKKAVPAAAAPAVEAKVEAAPAPAAKAADADTKKAAAEKAAEAKAAEKAAEAKPAEKIAPANLKGFGKNEEKRKPAPVAAAVELPLGVIANPAMNQEQLKQIQEQYKQQLQPILISELAFIRMTCDLPKDKRGPVLKAGRAVLEDAALKLAEQQNRARGGVRVAVQASTVVNDPPKAIREGLDAALKEVLTEEQLKLYREEAAYRKEQIKQAAIHSVIARLDGMLCLTAESRDKIAETIGSNWQESYERWLQIHQYGDQYFPSIPDQLVSVHLNPEQRQIWTGLQKIGLGGWGNFNGLGVAVADDGWWGEPLGPANANGAIFINGAIGIDVDF